MTTKFDQFAASNKASVGMLFALNAHAFDGMEQLTALNLQTFKTLLAEARQTSQTALLAKSPADLLKLQADALQAAPQKAIAYGNQVQAIFASIAAAQRATFDAQSGDMEARFMNAVNGAMKGGLGTDQFLTLAKSIVAAGNNAYDGANEAARQVSDALSANVAKVTDAAAKNPHAARATVGV